MKYILDRVDSIYEGILENVERRLNKMKIGPRIYVKFNKQRRPGFYTVSFLAEQNPERRENNIFKDSSFLETSPAPFYTTQALNTREAFRIGEGISETIWKKDKKSYFWVITDLGDLSQNYWKNFLDKGRL